MTVKLKVYLLVLGLALAAPVLAQTQRPFEPLNPAKAQSLPTSPLTIDAAGKTLKFTVELAATAKEQEIGLMHRNAMAEDHGMIFDFHEERRAAFWMRNTFIPLDMIFIRDNGVIEAIKDNAVPHSEAPIGPRQPVRAVLELVGGAAQKMGIKPGDRVHHAVFGNAPAANGPGS